VGGESTTSRGPAPRSKPRGGVLATASPPENLRIRSWVDGPRWTPTSQVTGREGQPWRSGPQKLTIWSAEGVERSLALQPSAPPHSCGRTLGRQKLDSGWAWAQCANPHKASCRTFSTKPRGLNVRNASTAERWVHVGCHVTHAHRRPIAHPIDRPPTSSQTSECDPTRRLPGSWPLKRVANQQVPATHNYE